jgi:hypothetical protein
MSFIVSRLPGNAPSARRRVSLPHDAQRLRPLPGTRGHHGSSVLHRSRQPRVPVRPGRDRTARVARPPGVRSLDAGPYQFIGLNTEELCSEERVAGEQLAWLEAELVAHRDAADIFVFMHRPLFSWFQGDFNPDDAARLQELFRTHPSGPSSRATTTSTPRRSGTAFATSLPAGVEARYTHSPPGTFPHYLLVHLDGERFDVEVIRADCRSTTWPATTASSR